MSQRPQEFLSTVRGFAHDCDVRYEYEQGVQRWRLTGPGGELDLSFRRDQVSRVWPRVEVALLDALSDREVAWVAAVMAGHRGARYVLDRALRGWVRACVATQAGPADRDAMLGVEELRLIGALAKFVEPAMLAEILGAADPSPSPVMRAALIAQLSRSATHADEGPTILPPDPDQETPTWPQAIDELGEDVEVVGSLHERWRAFVLRMDDGQMVVTNPTGTWSHIVTRTPIARRRLCAVLAGLRALDGLATMLSVEAAQEARASLVTALRSVLDDPRSALRRIVTLVWTLDPQAPSSDPGSPVAAVVGAVDRYAAERTVRGTARPPLLALEDGG